MAHERKLLMVSNIANSKQFVPLLEKEGISVTVIENFADALRWAKEAHPGMIVFILPVYWENITKFVEEIRAVEGFSETPIVYIGNLIEGEDQRILKRHNVKTLALGPVPIEEMVRFILTFLPPY